MAKPQSAVASRIPDVQLEISDRVAWITFDRPGEKVNLLTVAVLREFGRLVEEVDAAARAGAVRAVVVRSAKPGFIAGADLNELASVSSPDQASQIAAEGHRILGRLGELGAPSLAAIGGTCLGGGLELALACTYRAAASSHDAQIGLPEVRLGLLPGLGGTTRLPRLIGLARALDLILTGRAVTPRDALRLGLVDEVLPVENFDAWIARRAQALARGERPFPARRKPPLLLRALDGTPLGRRLLASRIRSRILRETRGQYPAALRALDVALRGYGRPLETGLRLEAQALGELLVSEVCKNLIAVFRMTERARKRAPAAAARPVRRSAVVGAGVMGAAIAELFAYRGIPVRLKDVDWARVADGVRRARQLLERAGRQLPAHELERRIECLGGAVDYTGFRTADVVIESVVEKMEVKTRVLRELEEYVGPDTVIASNTSALSITELQDALRRPERFCGMHFFNPAHRMPLLELVRGRRTDDTAIATAFAAATLLGKTPVLVADAPGFLVNRVLGAYLTEAGHLVQEGMKPRALEAAMESFGMPMGPLRLLDEIGFDVARDALVTLQTKLGPRFAAAPAIERALTSGRLGKKGGLGFYRYRGDRPAGLDPEILRTLGAGATPRTPTEEAPSRMVLAMVNEAARALADGVVATAEDVDTAMILGTGFPPFRGGLLRYADSVGVGSIVQQLHRLADAAGERLRPAPLLEDMARAGRGFYA